MGLKNDLQVGLRATVHAPKDAVVAACSHAAAFLGEHATVSTAAARVTIKIRPGLSAKRSKVSPTVAIDLRPASEGVIDLNAHIEQYLTLQSRMMMVIPIGPKRLVGKSQYRNLLQSLENELRAVDRGCTIRRTGAGL
jgi:hypothetical protein